MQDPIQELEAIGRLLRWDKECAIDYLGLAQVQRLDEMQQGESLTQETPFGPVMVTKVAGEYRVILMPQVQVEQLW